METLNHTPEPWTFKEQGEACDFALIMKNGNWLMSFRQNGELMSERQTANARRIVSCINACAGIADPAATIAETITALEALLEDNERLNYKAVNGNTASNMARAALSKLKGE